MDGCKRDLKKAAEWSVAYSELAKHAKVGFLLSINSAVIYNTQNDLITHSNTFYIALLVHCNSLELFHPYRKGLLCRLDNRGLE